jgi:hypothetical protein
LRALLSRDAAGMGKKSERTLGLDEKIDSATGLDEGLLWSLAK